MAVHTSFHQQFEGLQERFEGLRSRYDLDGVKLSIASLSKELEDAESLLRSLEIKSYFSGKYDENDAILSIHAGQGGTEAMDWAQMVKRMYLRFFEKKGWKCVQLDENQGDEAGIKSCVL